MSESDVYRRLILTYKDDPCTDCRHQILTYINDPHTERVDSAVLDNDKNTQYNTNTITPRH